MVDRVRGLALQRRAIMRRRRLRQRDFDKKWRRRTVPGATDGDGLNGANVTQHNAYYDNSVHPGLPIVASELVERHALQPGSLLGSSIRGHSSSDTRPRDFCSARQAATRQQCQTVASVRGAYSREGSRGGVGMAPQERRKRADTAARVTLEQSAQRFTGFEREDADVPSRVNSHRSRSCVARNAGRDDSRPAELH